MGRYRQGVPCDHDRRQPHEIPDDRGSHRAADAQPDGESVQRVVRDAILKIISEAGLNNPPAEVVDVKVPGEAQAGKPFKHVFKNNCVNIVCPEDARLGDTIKVVIRDEGRRLQRRRSRPPPWWRPAGAALPPSGVGCCSAASCRGVGWCSAASHLGVSGGRFFVVVFVAFVLCRLARLPSVIR